MDFDKTLLEAVDYALLSFGESPRKAIYYHLDRSFKIRKEEIPAETDRFIYALDAIFGSGAEVIEKLIVKNLYIRLNLGFEEQTSLEIPDSINIAREIANRERQQTQIMREKPRGR